MPLRASTEVALGLLGVAIIGSYVGYALGRYQSGLSQLPVYPVAATAPTSITGVASDNQSVQPPSAPARSQSPQTVTNPGSKPAETPTPAPAPGNNTVGIALTTAEVARHNAVSDCWFIVGGIVYDVTKFIFQHPGGAGEIIPYCGRDATQAFLTRGGTGQHSSFAQQELASLAIGQLGGTTTSVQIQSAQTNGTNTPRTGREEENDDD